MNNLIGKMVYKDIRGLGGVIFQRKGSILTKPIVQDLIKHGISESVLEYCCTK